MHPALPFYARFAAVAGRPVVLLAALAMSAPGEYDLAVAAGWSPEIAWLMPLVLTVYAAVASVMAATRPDSRSARVGAVAALALALSAQMTAHLMGAGHLESGAWLVAAVSAVPPLVAGHVMHMAAMPRTAPEAPSASIPARESSGTENGAQGHWPDDLWADFESSATDARPPNPDTIKAAIDELSADGREVTGRMLADRFGVSERTGRRYLEKAA